MILPSKLTIFLHTQSVHNVCGVGVGVGVGVVDVVGCGVGVGVVEGVASGVCAGFDVGVGVGVIVLVGVGVGVGSGHSPVQTPPCTNSPPSYDGVSNAQNL